MNLVDWIGFFGVSILLFAYFLNLKGILKKDGVIYLILNFSGGSIACFASVLLNYLPFIILEGCWALVSAFTLFITLKNKDKQLCKS